MFAPGSTAGAWTCLRCEIRRSLRASRATAAAQARPRDHSLRTTRLFSRSARSQDDQATASHDEPLEPDAEDPSKLYPGWKILHPAGKVLGRRGRRRLQTAEKLKIKSLDQPSEIILLRDIHEKRRKQQLPEASPPPEVSAQELAAILAATQNVTPAEAEVNASIDSLRPDIKLVSPKARDQLAKDLRSRYSSEQLATYLRRMLAVSTFGGESVKVSDSRNGKTDQRGGVIRRSEWHAGQTPLEHRHPATAPLSVKTLVAKQRSSLATQIIKLAWQISTQLDDQVGELEMVLQPWQMRYLFDLVVDAAPMYQSIIGSSLILRRAEVRPYRPDHIVRITAPKAIAVEVASQLELVLSHLHRVDIDLSMFTSQLGKPGWPEELADIFHASDLSEIEQDTSSVLEWQSRGLLRIYNAIGQNAYMARRLLVSTLQLPRISRSTTLELASLADHAKAPQLYPESWVGNLHARHRHKELLRLTVPCTTRAKYRPDDRGKSMPAPDVWTSADEVEEHKALAHQIAHQLDSMELASNKAAYHTSGDAFWQSCPDLATSYWSAQICRILRVRKAPKVAHGGRPGGAFALFTPEDQASGVAQDQTVIQTHVAGIADLLSCFTPMKYPRNRASVLQEPYPPQIHAQLMPSPFTAQGLNRMSVLPRVGLTYDVVQRKKKNALNTISLPELRHMAAVVEEHDVRVPLPGGTSDLRFTRHCELRSLGNPDELKSKLEYLDNFNFNLTRSLLNEQSNALVGVELGELPAPQWPKDGDPASAWSETSAEYMLEHLQRVQTVDFVPMLLDPAQRRLVDPQVRAMLDYFPRNAFLRYREIATGHAGESTVDLRLMWLPTQPDERDRTPPADIPKHRPSLALANTALALARTLSRIEAGTLQVFRHVVRFAMEQGEEGTARLDLRYASDSEEEVQMSRNDNEPWTVDKEELDRRAPLPKVVHRYASAEPRPKQLIRRTYDAT